MENTFINKCLWCHARDHLHIRGEYLKHFLLNITLKGSPPHTWRIQPAFLKTFLNSGITSTYVENTDNYIQRFLLAKDHLHIRGEYTVLAVNSMVSRGSPPHTWRILINLLFLFLNYRITSTYVENTC